jgi:hypothetical protein
MKIVFKTLVVLEILFFALSLFLLDTKIGLYIGYCFIVGILPTSILWGLIDPPTCSKTYSTTTTDDAQFSTSNNILKIRINSDLDRLRKLSSRDET